MNALCLRRLVANVVIVTFIVVITIDALPSTCTAHQRLKNTLDPALDMTGLWQEPWRLFAPEPDTINTRLSAVILFDDGSQTQWNSPDWQAFSAWQRFVHFRQMEYFDKLRMDDHSVAWEPFARYLARTVVPESKAASKAVRVELTRHWVRIPNPLESRIRMPVGGDWSKSAAWQFYTWEAAQ